MEEYVDIVDSNDNVVGKASRDDCHNNPSLLHRTVQFTLVNANNKKILLTQRSFAKKTDPGKYCFLGEHVISGENYETTLHRGILEELNVRANTFKEAGNNIFRIATFSELVKFFVVEIDNSNLSADPSEISNLLWLTLKELRTNNLDLSDMTRFWIKQINWEELF